MSLLLDLYLNQFLVFVMVLARVGGLVMGMPILGSRSIPMQVRALLAVAVSLLIAPLYWGVSVQYPGNILHLICPAAYFDCLAPIVAALDPLKRKVIKTSCGAAKAQKYIDKEPNHLFNPLTIKL